MAVSVNPGEVTYALVTWRNLALAAAEPEFSLDLRNSSQVGATWIEGEWIKALSTAAGATSDVELLHTIYSDWGGGLIDARVSVKKDGERVSLQEFLGAFQASGGGGIGITDMIPMIMMVMMISMIMPMMEEEKG